MDNFANCPPGIIQWRTIEKRDDWHRIRSLWRTENCAHGRWHYWENPCNCAYPVLVSRELYQRHGGYVLAHAEEETGTWRRDWRAIASAVQKFRAELTAQRQSDAAGMAACGPQRLKRGVKVARSRCECIYCCARTGETS